jgi:hypothetical protein
LVDFDDRGPGRSLQLADDADERGPWGITGIEIDRVQIWGDFGKGDVRDVHLLEVVFKGQDKSAEVGTAAMEPLDLTGGNEERVGDHVSFISKSERR